MKIQGKWWISLYGPELKEERQGSNAIVDDGVSFVASFLGSAAAAASTFTMRYIAIGTDATAETTSDTALGAETGRVAAVVSNVTGAIYRLTGTFPSGTGTGAIAEYGVFSTITGSGGTMLSRDVEGVVTKGANDTLQAITEITLANG